MYKATDRHNEIIKEVYERYYKDLFRLAISFLKDPVDAEDAIQECFVALMRKPERYQEIRDLRFYLFRIVQNKCLAILKNKKVIAVKHEHFLYYQCTIDKEIFTPDMHTAIDREKSKFTVEWFFSFLTPQRKKVVELVYLEQKSYIQAAAILGISKESIKTHLRLAKSALKGQRA